MRSIFSSSVSRRWARSRKVAVWVGILLTLLAIFASYLRPSFVLDLASRFVLCF